MSNSQYTATSANLKELFTKEFRESIEKKKFTYFVPKYQRPYSWHKKLVITLWEDILYTINVKNN